MSLKDRIHEDVTRVFMHRNRFGQHDHFGETHYWNGVEIECTTDADEALKRKNNNVNDISWDNNIREIMIYTPLDGFPGGRKPEPNTHVIFDERSMKVLSADDNMGMLEILLTAHDPREMM